MKERSHLALLAFAWGALLRRPHRTFALVGGLATTVALTAGVLFATSALRAEADRARRPMPDIVVQKLVGGRPALLDPSALAFAAGLPGVRKMEPRIWGYVFFPSLRANVTVVARRGGAADLGAVPRALASGRDAQPGERGVAVLGRGLAALLQVGPGDLIALPSPREDAPTLRVIGVFDSPVELYTNDVALVDAEDARVILDLPADRATDVAIDLAAPEEGPVVTSAILEKDPSLRVLDKRVLARTHRVTYGRRAGIVLAAALPALLCMLVLAWDRLGGVGPSERREIAVQKAVGWSTADVLYAKLYESVLVGSVAVGAGAALGYAWVFPLGAPLLREALSGWSVLYPSAPLTPDIDPADLVGLAALVLVPFVATSILPAWRSAILDPMQAMRS